MVWFQCEDCGDNLKKPKLAAHFRQCSAFKLSCIDCGQVFGQQEVESHTQCITEAEKYGPKGQGNAINGSNTKPKKDIKQKEEVDINVGLSKLPPWFCSLCNTKATSKQTLLAHAEGKKHRAKARAFHTKQHPNCAAETTENNVENQVPVKKDLVEQENHNLFEVSSVDCAENIVLESKKKRKLEKGDAHHENGGDISAEVGNGKVLQTKTEVTNGLKKAKHGGDISAEGGSFKVLQTKTDITNGLKKAKLGGDISAEVGNNKVLQTKAQATNGLKKAKHSAAQDNNVGNTKIKWKKLITSALKSNPDGALKLKKLTKHIVKSLRESGHEEEKQHISEVIEHKINSSSRFIIDGEYVRLAISSSS